MTTKENCSNGKLLPELRGTAFRGDKILPFVRRARGVAATACVSATRAAAGAAAVSAASVRRGRRRAAGDPRARLFRQGQPPRTFGGGQKEPRGGGDFFRFLLLQSCRKESIILSKINRIKYGLKSCRLSRLKRIRFKSETTTIPVFGRCRGRIAPFFVARFCAFGRPSVRYCRICVSFLWCEECKQTRGAPRAAFALFIFSLFSQKRELQEEEL